MSKQTPVQEPIFARASEIADDIRAIRRHIHKQPELSFRESATASYVAEHMSRLGYKLTERVGGTGLVADIGSGKTIAIRADMDALPIQEENQCDYASTVPGVMHACGHDAHTACAIGAATLLSEQFQAGKLPGRVRFLFQPAEETANADGKTGAVLMLEHGVLADVNALIGLHVDPRLPTGAIAVCAGPLLAASDTFTLTIRGKGSHAAWPELGIDAVVLASHVVLAMQQVISRRKSALDPAVLTVGGIRSKTYASNVIAEEVELTGTVRYFDKHIHELALQEIKNACSIADALGGSYHLDYIHDTPALVNNSLITDLVRKVGQQMLGTENVVQIGPQLGADDFSFFTAHVPSCYFVLGVRTGETPAKIHTPTFNINEQALPIGAAMLAQTALAFFAS